MKSVLITGSSGFIGQALSRALLVTGKFQTIRLAVRSKIHTSLPTGLGGVAVGDIGPMTDWTAALTGGVDCVVHCAARAHVIRETAANELRAYLAVNTDGTRRLAEQAACFGVKRIVFLSSIGVLGVQTKAKPFDSTDPPNPLEKYAVSKWRAEQSLWEIASEMGVEIVVVRPPLVYGPNVKGNFARLLNLACSGLPLPLAAVDNRRSFIGLDNLVDLLIRCVDHPKAAGQTLLVSDGQDLSTPELLRMVANAMGRPARLFPVPVPILRLAGRALGRLNEVDRLVSSLQVEISPTRELLGWNPSVSVEEGIKRMVMGTYKA